MHRRVDGREGAVDGERDVLSLAEAAGEREQDLDHQPGEEEVLALREELREVGVERLEHLDRARLFETHTAHDTRVRRRVRLSLSIVWCVCVRGVLYVGRIEVSAAGGKQG